MGILIAIAATFVLTLLAVLVVRNAAGGEKQIRHEVEPLYRVGDEQFLRSINGLLPPSFTDGNRVAVLSNGDQIFPAMLDAIGSAERTITMETFIYWSGDVGRRFAEALAERARQGVKVHVLLDWLGSAKMDDDLTKVMTDAGVEVERYHKPTWRNVGRVNHRTHRKLLVVDGAVGFTGGVGIADEWRGDAQDEHHWRDLHFRVDGPAVAQLQTAFMDNWLKVKPRVLHGPEYFPPLTDGHGPHKAQVFLSSPEGGSESARLMYLMSIASAARSVRIGTAYFVPDDLSVKTLCAAADRGVSIDILVPGEHIDQKVVRRASRALWGELLACGIRLHEFEPTMYHTKLLVVDDCWASVGSSNFDSRSLKLNDEVNLNVHHEGLARELSAIFDADLERAHRITLDEWRRRPLREKLIERTAALLRPQL